MKDFTLYLNFIDSTRFSKEDSRYGLSHFADEWKVAWQSYERHVLSAALWLPIDVVKYALAEWRQDLRNELCVRKKPVTAIEFSAIKRIALFNISNPILGKDLALRYERVTELSWKGEETVGLYEPVQAGKTEMPALYVEELRFPTEGVIEHEVLFLNGSRLLITAESLALNLSDYMGNI